MVKNALAVGDPSGEAYIAPPADPLPRLTAGVHAYMCKEGERRGKKKEGGVWTAKLQLHYIRHCTWLHIFSTGMASLSFSSTLRRQCNFCIQGDTISQTLLPRKQKVHGDSTTLANQRREFSPRDHSPTSLSACVKKSTQGYGHSATRS